VLVILLAAGAGAAAYYAVQSVSAQRHPSGYVPSGGVTAAPAETTIVFLGDAGFAARGTDAWPARVADQVDLMLVSLDAPGAGYVTRPDGEDCPTDFCPNILDLVPDAVGTGASVVVIAAGAHDAEVPVGQLRAQIDRVFTALRIGLPDAEIIAVGPAAVDPVAAETVALEGTLKATATAADVTYVSLLSPSAITAGQLDDGALSDAGQTAIAARVADAIDR